MPKIEAMLEGRFRSGGRNRSVTEIVYGPNKTVVWPVQHSFVILSAPVVSYTGAWTAIAANGSSSRAFITARVQEYAGDTPIGSPYYHDLEIRELVGNVKDEYVINGQTVALDRFYVDSENAICGNNLMDHPTAGYSISVKCGLGSQNYTVTVNQQANTATQTDTQKVYDGFMMTISNNTFGPTGGTATIGGIASYTTAPIYTWTSGATSVGDATPGTESMNPTGLYAARDPMSAPYPTISGMNITFQPNTLGVNITYTISGNATLDGVTYSSNVKAYVQETSYTYSDMVIQSYGYANIPAAGGSVYPGITFKLKCYENGTLLGEATGSVANGDTVGYASIPNVLDVAVDVAYYIGSNQDTSNGRVYADSKGTTLSGVTTVATNRKVTLSKGSATATSSAVSVSQGLNRVEQTIAGSMNITSFSATATPNPLETAGQATVVIQAVATGSGTTTKKIYTSTAEEGGASIVLNNTPVTPTSLKVDNVVQQNTSQFDADNRHNLTAKSYAVVVGYEGATSNITVTQVADEKIPDTATYHATLTPNLGSNDIWAGGGSILLVAEAWHTSGMKWKSDNQSVSGESQTEQDIAYVTLNLTQSSNDMFSFTVEGQTATTKTFRLTHRDMKKVVGTDAVSVVANNNGATSSSASYSVANALGNTPYESEGEVVWGAEYAGARAYQVSFGGEIIAYSNQATPAPFVGITNVGYSVQGSHEAATLHDGTLPLYTDYRYDSWSAAHDDNDHRERTTTYDTERYRAQLVAGSSWTRVYTDPVVVEPHDTYSWLTINTTTKKISMAAQSENANERYARIDFYNANDSSASGSTNVYQKAWANLSSDAVTYNFGWRGGSTTFVISARYTGFTVAHTGNWIGVGIRVHLSGNDPVYPTGQYGSDSTNTQYDLVISGTINDEEHNPTGYTHERVAEITLTPTDGNVSPVYIQLRQEEYNGGADQ